MNEENRISRQISVYKTDKKLVELIDKLNPAPEEMYAHLHAQGDEVNGKRSYSLIGILIQDYSNGTGENTKRANANLSPDEVQYVFSKAYNGTPEFEFHTDKIFGEPDNDGMKAMTKLTIRRAIVGSDGAPRRYPWYIEIENGKGIAQKTQLGGTYCRAGSFVSEVKLFANISDIDFFKLFHRASRFIDVWEIINGAPLVKRAKG